MSQRGKVRTQYVFFFYFLLQKPYNWIKRKTSDGGRVIRTLFIVIVLTFYRAFPPTPSISGLVNDHMAVKWLCGWKPYSSALDCWLGHLKHWQITWYWCLQSLTFGLHVCHNTFPSQWPSYCSLLSHQLLQTANPSFFLSIRKTRSQGYCEQDNGLEVSYPNL